jgi:clan AA aspartic protease
VISGTINSELEAIVRLSIRGPWSEIEIEAIIDTGFNGALILPPDIIATLGLSQASQVRGVLADGSERAFPLYEALILWGGRVLRIPVGAADTEPLLGMSLMYGNELAMQVIEGGGVSIREMPSS